MTHGVTSLRALAAFMVVVAVTTGTSAYISVLDEMNDSDPLQLVTVQKTNVTVEPPPPEPYVPKAMPGFANLTFADDFVLPLPQLEPVPIVHMVGPGLEGIHGKEMLEMYDLYWIGGSTHREVGKDYMKLRNDTRFISISTRTGRIHYDEDDRHGKRGVLVTDIETNSSLLNRSEARQLADGWLVEHNLYNSSWTLKGNWSDTISGSLADPGKRIINYIYIYIPVVDGMTVYGRAKPRLLIEVSPYGQVTEMSIDTAELVVGPDTSPFTFPDPVDMLTYFDENLRNLTCWCNQFSKVVSVVPAYATGEELNINEDWTTAWPSWHVSFYWCGETHHLYDICL